MRLINTTTLEIEEFFDISIPEYAILSHTWGDGEVSLQDWADRKNRRFKPGFQKIMWACTQAAKDKLDYVWVDTNCIDKSSSAELSEAINSMFKWYRRSTICYVYLEDVPAMTLDQCIEQDSVFRSARWFTRGWTLQELIASPNINFFSNDWTPIATKPELALCISEITGIAWSCLLKGRLSKSHPLRRYSVAQRLAWASRRSTTRIEDQAYSLLGLFDITIPLVYGEGHEAFTRLLGEIIHKYADHSFFASQLRYVDFLPRSPMEFCESQSVVVSASPQLQKHYIPGDHSYPFNLTNTGFQITLPIVTTLVPHFVFGVLDCWDLEKSSTQSTRSVSRIWIPLLQKGPERLQQYARLLWPQTFFPVKLVRKQSITRAMDQEENIARGSQSQLSEYSLFWAGERSYIDSTATSMSRYIDPISTGFHRSIHIKKPYATILSVPPWHPREAGSPFLICFPRGIANYRLYGIFPSDSTLDAAWSAGKPPLLPLVQPRRIQGKVEKEDGGGLYGAVVVFKKRRVRPARFVAICLTNVGQPHDDDKSRIKFIPKCKIIRGWDTWKAQDVQNIDFYDLSDVDPEGEVLVTMQKVSSNLRSVAQGSEPRFVGLTQVIFDRTQMMDELYLSPNQVKREPEGVLQHYGQECSDEDVGDLI
ncbi:HET domain-containing protein [Fusarium sp. LHS14.1]|nr:HET domain-containing protein [Fusarium sp. LHS14.1]